MSTGFHFTDDSGNAVIDPSIPRLLYFGEYCMPENEDEYYAWCSIPLCDILPNFTKPEYPTRLFAIPVNANQSAIANCMYRMLYNATAPTKGSHIPSNVLYMCENCGNMVKCASITDTVKTYHTFCSTPTDCNGNFKPSPGVSVSSVFPQSYALSYFDNCATYYLNKLNQKSKEELQAIFNEPGLCCFLGGKFVCWRVFIPESYDHYCAAVTLWVCYTSEYTYRVPPSNIWRLDRWHNYRTNSSCMSNIPVACTTWCGIDVANLNASYLDIYTRQHTYPTKFLIYGY